MNLHRYLQAHRNPKPMALARARMGTMTITTFVPSFIGPVFGLAGWKHEMVIKLEKMNV